MPEKIDYQLPQFQVLNSAPTLQVYFPPQFNIVLSLWRSAVNVDAKKGKSGALVNTNNSGAVPQL
jgi:hypothetical protein